MTTPRIEEMVEELRKRLNYCDFEDQEDEELRTALTEARQAGIDEAVERQQKDTQRLDFLDACNKALNDHYKTNYGWKLILNHNVTRLMSEGGLKMIDLHDAEGSNTKLKSCRDAIDQALDDTIKQHIKEVITPLD